jgi:hypothetical protein
MVRTQIQLTESQSSGLKAIAANRGVSMAEVIRQGIDAVLAQGGVPSREDAYRRAAQAAGRFHSDKHDIATRHDEYLGQGDPS